MLGEEYTMGIIHSLISSLMKKSHLVIGVLAVVVIAGGLALTSPSQSTSDDSSLAASVGTAENANPNKTVTVTYTEKGFVPTVVSVNRGDSIIFVNMGGKALRIAPVEDPKDATSAYIGFAASKSIRKGETFGVSITQPGIWAYKDLNSPKTVGVVIAE